MMTVYRPFAAHAIDTPAHSVCASCGYEEALSVLADPKHDFLCQECLSPLTSLDYPQYFYDIGGEA